MSNEYLLNKVESLLGKHFIEYMDKHGGFYVAGGCLTSLSTNKEVNDIDIYFPDRKSLTAAIQWMQDDGAWCCFISEKSITYTCGGITYQFIYYDFYEKPEDIFNHFDFTINMCAYSSLTKEIVQHNNFMMHNAQRHLSFNPDTKFPIISALRVDKYQQRGYKIPRNEFVKIMLAVNKLEINSWQEFKNQCGNLYGLNYINDETIKDKSFSLDNAFEVIANTSFEGNSIVEFKVDPRIVDVVVSGEELEYINVNGKCIAILEHEDVEVLDDLLASGNIPCKEVSLKDHLGEYLYKWVRKDLCSHAHNSFQYKLNEECEASRYGWGNGDPVLWMLTKDKLLTGGCYSGQGVILKCKYEVEDVTNIQGDDVLITKVTPVEVLTEEDFRLENNIK